jgi:hypothetical protein
MFERTMGIWNFDNLRNPLFLDVDLTQNMKQREGMGAKLGVPKHMGYKTSLSLKLLLVLLVK